MGTGSIRIFKLLGFPVWLHLSWLIVAVLLTWTLATGYFPAVSANFTPATNWAMGFAGMLGLFVSVLLHETGHCVIARNYGIPIKGITLFVFGGVAEMEREPPTARAEFDIAIAGPVVSFALAVVFYASVLAAANWIWPLPVTAVLSYLAGINGMIAVFNLAPAFPLDGGRILRAFLWHRRKDLRSATRTASRLGSAFGAALIALGLFNVLIGAVVSGMWWALLGLFIRGASRMSYEQVTLRSALQGEPISRFMNDHPVTVKPETTIDQFVEDYVYHHYFKFYPVVRDSHLVGCMGAHAVKELPREEWSKHHVVELMNEWPKESTVSPDTDALETLTIMNRSGNNLLPVVDRGRLVGLVSLRDLLRFLSVKLDLEGIASPSERSQILQAR